jgi:hypothetical protein
MSNTKTDTLPADLTHRAFRLAPFLVFLAIATLMLAASLLEPLTTERHRSYTRPPNAYVLVTSAQLAFWIFLWPLTTGGRGVRAQRGGLLLFEFGVVWALSLPFVLIAGYTSDTDLGGSLPSQLYVATVACLVFACMHRLILRGRRRMRYYIAVAFGLCVAVPLHQWIFLDVLGTNPRWLAVVSPFWLLLHIRPGQSIHSGFYAWGLALMLLPAAALFLSVSRTREHR